MNGFTLLVLIVLVAGIPIAFRVGGQRAQRDARMRGGAVIARTVVDRATEIVSASSLPVAAVAPEVPECVPQTAAGAALDAERARLIRAAARESWMLRSQRSDDFAAIGQLREFAEDRRQLQRALADAMTDTARYREIVVDLEDNAPPLLLDVPNSPDDLKLIVGVGPVLERLLQRMGIGSYRQIARWSEHEINHFDAQLPEFRGRIRRDGWVTQARALHQSKYGERAT
ncbi:MAG: hypothetical protein ABI440_11420 [Casimicrobiaceae bacterium]